LWVTRALAGHPTVTGPAAVAAPGGGNAAWGGTPIVLESARFGAENAWVDVTEKCRGLIVGDLLLAPRGLSEALGVDPARGGGNTLELNLLINGAARVRLLVADHRKVAPIRLTTNLPADSPDEKPAANDDPAAPAGQPEKP
jgi:hypothetical protein